MKKRFGNEVQRIQVTSETLIKEIVITDSSQGHGLRE